MTDIATPLGPIPASPTSADDATVILWVVGVLMIGFILVLFALWRKMVASEAECRTEASEVRKQNERLYQAAIEATAVRETRLVEVVERNTAAFNALKDTVGSGYYKALREERLKGERRDG